jgi:hypothetical protein
MHCHIDSALASISFSVLIAMRQNLQYKVVKNNTIMQRSIRSCGGGYNEMCTEIRGLIQSVRFARQRLDHSAFCRVFHVHVVRNFSLQLVNPRHCHEGIDRKQVVVHWRNLGAETGPYKARCRHSALLWIRNQLWWALKVSYVGYGDRPLECRCLERHASWEGRLTKWTQRVICIQQREAIHSIVSFPDLRSNKNILPRSEWSLVQRGDSKRPPNVGPSSLPMTW